MGEAIVSDLFTEILIPVAAVIEIAFAPFQWVLVSKVKLSPEPPSNNKNGLNNHLLKEEGHSAHDVVTKCSEIQNAVSEGGSPHGSPKKRQNISKENNSLVMLCEMAEP